MEEDLIACLQQKGQEVMEEYGRKKCQRKCQVAGLCERSAGVRPLVYKQKRPSRAALWPVQPQKHVWHSCSKCGRSSTFLISIQFKISHEGRCLAVRLRSSGSAKKNIKVDYLNCFLHGVFVKAAVYSMVKVWRQCNSVQKYIKLPVLTNIICIFGQLGKK